MFQLKMQDNVFRGREQGGEREEVTYYSGLPGQFKDEETVYEEYIPTNSKEHGTDQYNSEDFSHVYVGPAAKVNFVRLQRDFMKSMKNAKDFPSKLESHAHHIPYCTH